MVTYQDLDIHSDLPPDQLGELVSKGLSADWTVGDCRNKGDKSIWREDTKSLMFSCVASNGRAAAALFISRHSEGGYYVSNICPGEGSPNPLGYERYNAILNDFYSRVIVPLENEGKLTAALFSAELNLEVELGRTAFDRLKAFSSSANKSTGSGHPSDRRMWFDFLLAAHALPERISSHTLLRWLVEQEGWPERQADDLQNQFEFGLELLDYSRNR